MSQGMGDSGLGTGDWGLGTGDWDWGLGLGTGLGSEPDEPATQISHGRPRPASN